MYTLTFAISLLVGLSADVQPAARCSEQRVVSMQRFDVKVDGESADAALDRLAKTQGLRLKIFTKRPTPIRLELKNALFWQTVAEFSRATDEGFLAGEEVQLTPNKPAVACYGVAGPMLLYLPKSAKNHAQPAEFAIARLHDVSSSTIDIHHVSVENKGVERPLAGKLIYYDTGEMAWRPDGGIPSGVIRGKASAEVVVRRFAVVIRRGEQLACKPFAINVTWPVEIRSNVQSLIWNKASLLVQWDCGLSPEELARLKKIERNLEAKILPPESEMAWARVVKQRLRGNRQLGFEGISAIEQNGELRQIASTAIANPGAMTVNFEEDLRVDQYRLQLTWIEAVDESFTIRVANTGK